MRRFDFGIRRQRFSSRYPAESAGRGAARQDLVQFRCSTTADSANRNPGVVLTIPDDFDHEGPHSGIGYELHPEYARRNPKGVL